MTVQRLPLMRSVIPRYPLAHCLIVSISEHPSRAPGKHFKLGDTRSPDSRPGLPTPTIAGIRRPDDGTIVYSRARRAALLLTVPGARA